MADNNDTPNNDTQDASNLNFQGAVSKVRVGLKGLRDLFITVVVVVVSIGILCFFAKMVVNPAGLKFDRETAQGLITLSITLSTVTIALFLTIFAVTGNTIHVQKNFDFGKQVLGILVGILGTIVGFYFGSAPKDVPAKIALSIDFPKGASVVHGNVASVNVTFSGGRPPYTSHWKYTEPTIADADDTTKGNTLEHVVTVPLGVKPDTKIGFTIIGYDADKTAFVHEASESEQIVVKEK